MADLIVNHVSSNSAQFQNWIQLGHESQWDGMFLTLSSVFPHGASEEDLAKIYRPRPGLPFTTTTMRDGTDRLIWTTFTSDQIDIDVESQSGSAYLDSILNAFASGGVNLVRLDAVGYAIKRPGTTCFMLPETYEFIEQLAERCRSHSMEVLLEIHGFYEDQISIAKQVDLVYDFALPPLVLDAIYTADTNPLKEWIKIRPTNCITVLDTHDGIGVIDVGAHPNDPTRPGLLLPERIDPLVNEIARRSSGESTRATGAAASNLDLYQVNCTYLDALGNDVNSYILARLIQVLLPGVPQVYYVGLLGGRNDLILLDETRVGRDINRHYYTPQEILSALDTPLVEQMLNLLRWRAEHPAFGGDFELIADSPQHQLHLRWTRANPLAEITAVIDLADLRFSISDRVGDVEVTTTSFKSDADH
jgi:sucrose phosphorylase